MKKNEFDVIIIGGGITGAGIARDCAFRNLTTLLIEKKDFASGTTGACSGFLHGGPRYLDSDPNVTRESCVESGIVQKIAPTICFRVPFVVPAFVNISSCNLSKLDDFFSKYDEFAPLKNSEPHVVLSKDELLALEPNLNAEIEGGVTFDEWGVDVFRLTLFSIISAVNNGAKILNHTKVVGFNIKDDYIESIVVQSSDGELTTIYGKVIVNASGPWVPDVCRLAGISLKLRKTKGVHLILDRRVTNIGVVSVAVDGAFREIFPHQSTTLIGCTDDDFFGSPDDIPITTDEINYIVEATSRAVPKLKQARIIRAMAGIRPMIFQDGILEGKVSRDFKLIDHQKTDNLKNFISMLGGKLVIYRLMAEKVTDLVCDKLNVVSTCVTSKIPLLTKSDEVAYSNKTGELLNFSKLNILSKFSILSDSISENIAKLPELSSKVCLCESVCEAEIRFSIKNEWVKTIDDIRRRLRVGSGPCQGYHCASLVAILLSQELNLSAKDTLKEIINFLRERWRGERMIVNGSQIIQEEIKQFKYINIYNLNNFVIRGENFGF